LHSIHSKAFLAAFLVIIVALTYPAVTQAQPTDIQMETHHRLKTNVSPNAVSGISPSVIKAVYNLPSTGGQGTIAIIDAYDQPNIASDLNTFCNQFGLPQANLEIHKMSSTVRGNTNWGLEIALDVEWAHAIAPNAKILLVEATSNSITNLLSAVNYAKTRSDVVAVSMSWGANEFSSEASYDSYFTSSYGAVFYASSGDNGAGTEWPAVSSKVVSVGGTTLTFSGGVLASETVWSGSGGGVSTYISTPTYQTGLGYSKRATPDVSYNADPNSGFAVYDSYGGYGWAVVGGTSAGAPQWAAIQALGASATTTNIYNIYSQPSLYQVDFRDITVGSNGYSAKAGYDLATGVGSPLTISFGAAPKEDFGLTASPSSLSTNAGTQKSTTINVASLNGFANSVSLSASAPTGWTTAFATNPITGGSGSSVLTITPPVGTTSGTYTVTVTGQGTDSSSNPITHTTTVTVTVSGGDYSLSPNPASLSIRRGNSGTSRITVNALNGYSGTVTLSAKSSSSLITPRLSASTVTAGSYATLTISPSMFTSAGTYTITITGADTKGLTHTTAVKVTVTR
jgi:subtilase family serine protease